MAPGLADSLDAGLVDRWNATIAREYAALEPKLGSRFFVLEPELADATPAAVEWFGDPAEPAVCMSAEVAQQLCDWGVRGRHALQDEYCEFAVISRPDAAGKPRAKRVQITTELAEYWTCLAVVHPDLVRSLVSEILGVQPSWSDLYGADPANLDDAARRVAFCRQMCGHGNHQDLQDAGVGASPVGHLNNDNALFMTHPINGLDDLIYIVLFGAKPYAVIESGRQRRKATRDEVFRQFSVEHLACRHADPAAAMGAYGAVWAGRKVTFADPLGMYLLEFNRDALIHDGAPIPDAWIRWSRGSEGMYQRLEIGPGDEDKAFLDDITVATGAAERPLVGGYQLLQLISVGPFVITAPTEPAKEQEYVSVGAQHDAVQCQEASFCKVVAALKADYDRAHAPVVRPRAHAVG
jgi:hypothetical protein